jgi:hypothetical protein
MFEARQDPHAVPAVTGLLKQNPTLPNDQCVNFDKLLHFGSRFPHRQRSRILCAAKRFNGADIASRLSSYTNKRAKVQKCGVKSRGLGFWEKTRSILPEGLPASVGID